MMLTIRRAIVIMIMLAIVFFIYRGISPSGADTLLLNIKHIPAQIGLLSGESVKHPIVVSGNIATGAVFTGTVASGENVVSGVLASTGKGFVFTSALASGGIFSSDAYIFPEQEVLVFTSTLLSGGLFALEALVIPSQNDSIFEEPLTTGGSLVIIPDTGTIPVAVVEQQPVIPTVTPPKAKPASHIQKPIPSINKDITLLNNLFK